MFFKRTNKYQGVAVLSEQREYISEPEKIRQALKQTGNYGFDLYDDREKIGFILLRQFSEKGFFLWDFIIDQKHQNKGYGTIFLGKLMPFLESEFGAQLLTTTYIEGNHHAQYLYEKTGFVEMDRVQVDTVWEVNLKKE